MTTGDGSAENAIGRGVLTFGAGGIARRSDRLRGQHTKVHFMPLSREQTRNSKSISKRMISTPRSAIANGYRARSEDVDAPACWSLKGRTFGKLPQVPNL